MTPAGTIDPQPWMTAPETRAVIAALTAKGTAVRFVGGCVRDAIVHRAVKDIDIATADVPADVAALLEAAGLRAIPTGIEHGTVTAVSGHRPFQITTLRVDVEPLGRKARVAFTGDWVADAERRDFTLNALYLDPDGTLYDPTGGLADLHAGRVRFVGDATTRIEEDTLRILRFFRIFAHYGRGVADASALAACRTHAAGLSNLSPERVAQELLRILAASDPAAVLALMMATGVLPVVLPSATDLGRLATLSRLDGADPDPVRRLAAVLGTDSAGARAVAESLRLPGRDRDRLESLAELPQVSPEAAEPVLRRALYRVGAQKFRDDVYLRWAEDSDGTQPGWRRLLAFPDRWAPPVFPLTGDDALAAGIARGPAVGEALTRVENWWIDSDFAPDRAACLAELRLSS